MVLTVADEVLVRLNVALRLEVAAGDMEKVGHLVGEVFEVPLEPLGVVVTLEKVVIIPL